MQPSTFRSLPLGLLSVAVVTACLESQPLATDTLLGPADTSAQTRSDTPAPLGEGDAEAPTLPLIISNFETSSVLPQSVAKLSVVVPPGFGNVVRQQWSVDQPAGSVSRLMPATDAKSPSFELNVAGDYTFRVSLFDPYARVIGTASHVIRAVPESDLHISLTWHTPDDLDESDLGFRDGAAVGSDVDLHLLRTDGGATWFDHDDDCYWENPAPSWSASPRHNPRLDREDADGGGPETINVADLTASSLSVGVHYYNASGFGPVFATVRIYLRGELAEEWADVVLVDADLWHSHTIDGATGAIRRMTHGETDGPMITARHPVNNSSGATPFR
jgi:hypothetical protein